MTQDEALLHEENHVVPVETLNAGDAEAISYLKREIASGKPWYKALLGAIGLWASAEEFFNGRTYVYLIDGEAFDWLVLAERLTETVKDAIPENERENLLFYGIPPYTLEIPEVKELIGEKKYKLYLNYFYGVTVEEGLMLAVQTEVDKEKHLQVLARQDDYSDEAFKRIYDEERDVLLQQFRREKYLPKTDTTSLEELKQFSYWLFKYRFKHCEKARIASDTNKALNYLKHVWQRKGVSQVLAVELNPLSPV
jgi:hypothetical protein